MSSSESYASLFTGDELDFAIAKSLGNKYRGVTTPGCHLVGDTTDNVVDLDKLLIPGKYTIYFYINGPASFVYDENTQSNMSEDDADSEALTQTSSFSVRPIYLIMYTSGGDHLYQTIMVGTRLYWRDMWSNENISGTHIPWRCSDLGVESSVITNNLEYKETGISEALSQRMGTTLVDMVQRLQIGNANLLNYTNGYFSYGTRYSDPADITTSMARYWHMENGRIATETYDDIRDHLVTYPTNDQTTLDFDLFPVFDDLDADIISMFRSTNTGAVFKSYPSTSTGMVYNKIYMSGNAQYTASVYLVFDPLFLKMQNENVAYISIIMDGDQESVVKTESIILNRLGTSMEETDIHDVPISNPGVPYCRNKILEQTDYETDQSYHGRFKVMNKAASEMGYYRLTVTITPEDLEDANITNIKIAFGFNGPDAKGLFVLPKVEYGEFATQYNHSWGDLYYYFTNCEAFFGVPINIFNPNEFENQDSFVYDANNNVFEAEPVAIGGGGGFVVHDRDDLTVETTSDNTRRYTTRNTSEKIPISYKPDGSTVILGHDNSEVDAQGYAHGGYQELYTGAHLRHYYPRYKHILFLNKQTNELLYWDELCNRNKRDGSGSGSDYEGTGGFVSLNKSFVIRKGVDGHAGPQPVDYTNDQSYTESFVGTNQFWLHKPTTTGQSAVSKAATIKYYDPDEEMWLTAKADAASIYVVQANAPGPEFLGKLWINSTTNAMYYSIMENNQVVWKPIFSIWGANPTV